VAAKPNGKKHAMNPSTAEIASKILEGSHITLLQINTYLMQANKQTMALLLSFLSLS